MVECFRGLETWDETSNYCWIRCWSLNKMCPFNIWTMLERWALNKSRTHSKQHPLDSFHQMFVCSAAASLFSANPIFLCCSVMDTPAAWWGGKKWSEIQFISRRGWKTVTRPGMWERGLWFKGVKVHSGETKKRFHVTCSLIPCSLQPDGGMLHSGEAEGCCVCIRGRARPINPFWQNEASACLVNCGVAVPTAFD